MKLILEFDSIAEAAPILAQLNLAVTLPAAEAPKAARKPREVPKVEGNPDAVAPVAAAVEPTVEPAVEPTVENAVTLPAGTDAKITKLLTDTSKQAVADGVIQISKDKGRAAAVAILEKFRPAGNTDALVKVTTIEASRYPDLAAEIIKAYA